MNDKETFLNWDTDFKSLYPFLGPVDITIEENNIHCFIPFNNKVKYIRYIPFIYNIKNYRFNVTCCMW